MTEKEFSILVKGMKAIYAQPTFIPDAYAFKVWFSLLEDLDYKDASAAIQKHMQTSPYPPTVADIRKQIVDIKSPDLKTDEQYFLEIKEAVQKSTYYSKEAFEGLSDVAKAVVRDASNLKTWAIEDERTFNEVQKSYILKAVATQRKNVRELQSVSPKLQQVIMTALSGSEVKKIEGD